MVTGVEAVTLVVVMAKVAEVAPAAAVTLAGTDATAELELERETTAPPGGAGPFNAAVLLVEGALPPNMLLGERVSEESTIGLTVNATVLVTPPKVAEIFTAVVTVTNVVLMVKEAEVAPAATVTIAGTEATAGLELETVTSVPPAGAGLLR